MITQLKPYPAYKDSGIPWIGKVPQHWSVLPNRALFNEVKERDHPQEQMLSVTITRGVIRQETLLEDTSKKDGSNLDRSAYKLVRSGDIVYNKMRAWQGAIGKSAFNGIVSPAYVVVRLRADNNGQYFHHLFRTPQFAKEAERWSYGITSDMWSLRPEHFRMIYCAVPSKEEQTAIVSFLNHSVSQINRLIGAKQKLIKLLEEQKRSIIDGVIVRGLNKSAAMRQSGVAWLGKIPKHWETRRLRFLIQGKLKYGANAAAEFDNPEWPRYLRITDFGLDGSLRNDTFRSLPPDQARDYMVRRGDLLFARSGATVGKAFLVTNDEPACHAGYLIRARLKQELIKPEFLFQFTQSRSFAEWKNATFIIATIQNIGADRYADLIVPVPPRSEQEEIVNSLQESLRPILLFQSRACDEIDLMHEYQTRLIADTVTGRLDVRNVTVADPVMGAEPTQSELSEVLSEEADMSSEEDIQQLKTEDYAD